MSKQQCITLKHVAEIRNGPSYKREHNQFVRCHDRVTTGAAIQTYLSNRMLRLALDKRQINQSKPKLHINYHDLNRNKIKLLKSKYLNARKLRSRWKQQLRATFL